MKRLLAAMVLLFALGACNDTTDPQESKPQTNYRSCEEASKAGVTPLHKGDPGYSSKLDRDGDGIACDK